MVHIKKHSNHDSYKDDSYSFNKSQPRKKNHKDYYMNSNLTNDHFRTVKAGTLNVCIIVLPGAKVDRNSKDNQSIVPNRVKRDIAAANKIWKQYEKNRLIQGFTFTITRSVVFWKTSVALLVMRKIFQLEGLVILQWYKQCLKLAERFVKMLMCMYFT